MKNKRFFLYILFFILFSHYSIIAQETSNFVYKFLKNNKLSPVTQNLINSGSNTFPYNIIQAFPAKKESSRNLVFVFYQEEIENFQEGLIQFLNFSANSDFDFNITVLFSYGENPKIEKQGIIYGSDTFISSLNTNEDFTAIILDLSSEKNHIFSNSRGIIAPSWLIKNEFDIFLNHNISENLPFYYLSQMYRFDFFKERILSTFLENNIPAVKLCINPNSVEQKEIADILIDSINKFSEVKTQQWDQHFLMLRHFNKYIRLSEIATIRIILVIFLIWLFFILMLIFINIRQKHHAWQKVRKIWYIVPATFILIFLSFIEGKFIYNLLPLKLSDVGKIYTLLSIQTGISFFNASLLYILPLCFNKDFEARSIDFLIILCCFINQSVFILVDISLFPIFMFICLLSILALSVKNNILHILIFILMIIPFIPYLHDIITYADLSALKSFVLTNNNISIAFTFILYPVFIVYFRILTYYRNLFWKKSSIYLGASSATLFIILVLFSVSVIRTKQIDRNYIKSNSKIIKNSREDLIVFDYFDKPIFTDTIRTINIKLKKQALQCDVTITGENHAPVLYTDNDFENITQKSVFFKIPENPPQTMSFTYGMQTDASVIKITAIFEGEENEFILVNKTVSLGE